MQSFSFLLIGYVCGCFQSAYIFSKLFFKKDIRDFGSGNAGTTNSFLTFGAATAACVFLTDLIKTVLAAVLSLFAFELGDPASAVSIACLGVALGHNFPFWLGFKGGKGVAVAIASMLLISPKILFISLFAAAVFSLLKRSVTYGSYTFAMMMSVCCVVFSLPLTVTLTVFAQSTMIVLLHLFRRHNNSAKKAPTE